MILVVDDDATFLRSAENLLNAPRGVCFAKDAQHARELLTMMGTEFSVVLVDLDLPDVDGFTLIQEIRTAFPHLPVIAISGIKQQNVLESAKIFGATDALRKPIGPEWAAAIARARVARNPMIV